MDLVQKIVKIYQVDHINNWIERQICTFAELLGFSIGLLWNKTISTQFLHQ
jgi:hypothetical protein